MSDLTLNEKMEGAERRARELAAEKHFYDAAQPFFPLGFSVNYRNPGHWDVISHQCPGRAIARSEASGVPIDNGLALAVPRERAFRIRGEPSAVTVLDERWNPHRERGGEPLTFRSVTGAMLWIVEELMQEPAPDA